MVGDTCESGAAGPAVWAGAKDKERARWGSSVSSWEVMAGLKSVFAISATSQPHTLTLQTINDILYFCVEQRF